MSPTSHKKAQLFVSHISEEAQVAALIKEMIEKDFLGLVNLFTSSDISSIDAGDKWLDAVQQAMNDASAVLVLCSRASVQRPWVQFEVGAAWMKDVPVIPVCHSGMKLTDLQMPLSVREGVELGTEAGLNRLYLRVARILNVAAPSPKDLAERLQRIADVGAHFRQSQDQQFELHIDIRIPSPGSLQTEEIPDSAVIESNATSLELFGLLPGVDRTWRDIVKAAKRTPDTRWVGELQGCIYLASNNEVFRPVQAIYHTKQGSFQPQLAKKEFLPDGACRFHVHFVETVVAPLFEVQNDFGLLATLLRLGLRFRYEVIECFPKIVRARPPQSIEGMLLQLRGAIEVIENDALSRGAEGIDQEAIVQLFDRENDQNTIAQIQHEWDGARNQLFDIDPPHTVEELSRIIDQMRRINYGFMDLGCRRFHEMITTRWTGGDRADGTRPVTPLRSVSVG